VALVDAEVGGRDAALSADDDLEGVQPAGRALVGERPHREAVERARLAADPRVLLGLRAQELVGGDPERLGKAGEVVEREAPLAGFQPAERRDVQAGARRDGFERQPALGAQLAQAPADAAVDGLVCLHGKGACQFGAGRATLAAWTRTGIASSSAVAPRA
jgi:hypothetical protein